MQPRADAVIVGAGACGSLVAASWRRAARRWSCSKPGRGSTRRPICATARANAGKIMWTRAARLRRQARRRAEDRRRRRRRHAGVARRDAAVPSRGLPHALHRRRRRRLADRLRRPAAVLRAGRARVRRRRRVRAVRAGAVRAADAAASHELARAGARARRAGSWAPIRSRRRWRSTPSPTTAGPRAATAAGAARAADAARRPRRRRPTSPGPSDGGAQVISEAFVHRVNYDAAHGSRDGRRVPRRGRAASTRRRRRRHPRRPRDRDAAAAAALGQRDVSRGPGQLQRHGRTALHEPSDVAGVRHVRRADQRLQGHADGPRDGAGLLQARCPHAARARLRADLLHDDAHHLRQPERRRSTARSSSSSCTTTRTPPRGGRTPRGCRRDTTR